MAFHIPNFTHSNLKIQDRIVIVRHYLRTKTERLNFYIKDKIIPTNSLKTDQEKNMHIEN